MRVNLSKLLPQKVTIINRLKSKDNESKRDKFYKTLLTDCIWDSKSLAHQNGKEVYYTKGYSVQIPDCQEAKYKPYSEWKDNQNTLNCFTLSLDDYVILGDVTEDITADNVTQIINKYSPFVFKISTITPLNVGGNGLSYDNNNFAMRYTSGFYVEGD